MGSGRWALGCGQKHEVDMFSSACEFNPTSAQGPPPGAP